MVRELARRTGSEEDAEEVVQEAFAKVLALDRPIGSLAGYLWRIAFNLAIDRRRQHTVHVSYSRAALPRLETQDHSAESTAATQQRLAIVERAIGELPPRCLEAFILHALNELPFDAVGREMGISGRMGRKHVARALQHLQNCLDDADATRTSPSQTPAEEL